MWSDRPLEKITLVDLQALVTDKVRENRQLDYKDEQPAHPRANNDKKSEFAVDVSALANGSGGLLIYGIAEEKDGDRPTGIPRALNGLAGFNLDADGNHLRTYLDTSLDPKLPTGLIEIHAVEGGARGQILLVRVRKSFSAPHMVRAEGRFRSSFYVRDGARNRQLDTRAVREAMFASGDWMRRFRTWRHDRVAAVLANETPVTLAGTRRLILHLAPVSALEEENLVDVREAQRQAVAKQVVSFGSSMVYRTESFNVDGLVISSRSPDTAVFDYLQVFRTGLLETVDTYYVHAGDDVPTAAIEGQLFALVPIYIDYLRGLGLELPVIVGVTLAGVRGMRHEEQPAIDRHRGKLPTFDRDVVTVPEVFVDAEQLTRQPTEYLAPIIHGLWQAGGRPACPRYRPDGTYNAALKYV